MPVFDPKHRLSLCVALLGFATIASQMLFVRELVVAFYGNELSLGVLFACWLFWTALGSGLLPEILPPRPGGWNRLRLVFILMALTVPLTVLAVRQGRVLLNSVSGEIVFFGHMWAAGLALFAPFCLLSGYAYAAACRMLPPGPEAERRLGAGRLYAVEAFGSAAGGLAASVLLFPSAPQALVAALLSGLCAAAGCLVPGPGGNRTRLWPALILLGSAAAAAFAPRLQAGLDRHFWNTGVLRESKNTAYGNVTVADMAGQVSFFENGQLLFTCPDRLSAEESVHYALLEHPEPRKILLVGGPLAESIEEAFRHPSVDSVQAVELNPEIIRLSRAHLPAANRRFLDDPRVSLVRTDARRFMRRTRERYDAVLLNLPDPSTLQINRFYTVEFFSEVLSRLNPGGVFFLRLPGSENAIEEELADFLSVVHAGLAAVFDEVVALPGNASFFIASGGPAPPDPARPADANPDTGGGRFLTTDPEALSERIRERGLGTVYVQPHYLRHNLTAERRAGLLSRLHPVPRGRLNRDFRPTAYWADLAYWTRRFGIGLEPRLRFFTGQGRHAAARVLLFLPAALVLVRARRRRGVGGPDTGLCVAAAGFTAISLELVLLVAFQALYGILYRDLALFVAGQMAGLGLGGLAAAGLGRKAPAASPARLAGAQAAAAGFPVLTWLVLILAHRMPVSGLWDASGTALFTAMNLAAGFIGGSVFGLSLRLSVPSLPARREAAQILYAVDLLGAVAGVLIVASFALPVLGLAESLLGIFTFNTAVLVTLGPFRPKGAAPRGLPGNRAGGGV